MNQVAVPATAWVFLSSFKQRGNGTEDLVPPSPLESGCRLKRKQSTSSSEEEPGLAADC